MSSANLGDLFDKVKKEYVEKKGFKSVSEAVRYIVRQNLEEKQKQEDNGGDKN